MKYEQPYPVFDVSFCCNVVIQLLRLSKALGALRVQRFRAPNEGERYNYLPPPRDGKEFVLLEYCANDRWVGYFMLSRGKV